MDTIRYRAGNEHNPSDPHGRTELTIEPDGAARLEYHTHAGVQEWEGTVDVERLHTALAAANFPAVDRKLLIPGDRVRTLIVESADGQKAGFQVGWDAPAAYTDVFAILDGVVEELGSLGIK